MTDPAFTVRRMARPELDLMIDWAAREGWNPGLRDAACFHAADPGGFFIGLLDGAPISAISAVSYGGAFGFLGCYLCVPEHRGKGYGIATWNAALQAMSVRAIGLDGVIEQQSNYRKSGFVLAHRNIRFDGKAVAATPDPDIVPLKEVDMPAVRALDLACFGYERTGFLGAWLNAEGHRVLGCFSGGRLDGYAVIRPCRENAKIGPLFAHSPEVAERLFDAAVATADGPVFLDAPEDNGAACDLAERKGLGRVFETARMYLGPAPTLPLNQIFGITTFELG